MKNNNISSSSSSSSSLSSSSSSSSSCVVYSSGRPSRKRFKPETFDPGCSNNAGFFETRAFKEHEGWAWGKDIKKKMSETAL